MSWTGRGWGWRHGLTNGLAAAVPLTYCSCRAPLRPRLPHALARTAGSRHPCEAVTRRDSDPRGMPSANTVLPLELTTTTALAYYCHAHSRNKPTIEPHWTAYTRKTCQTLARSICHMPIGHALINTLLQRLRPAVTMSETPSCMTTQRKPSARNALPRSEDASESPRRYLNLLPR